MPKITLLQAAKQGWPSRATLYRAIKTGKVSAVKDDRGATVVDTAELVRVYGEPVSRDAQPSPQGDSTQLAVLQSENARLREDLADARAHRDRLMTLLEARPLVRRGWWARITGGAETRSRAEEK